MLNFILEEIFEDENIDENIELCEFFDDEDIDYWFLDFDIEWGM